jgi:ribosomal protein S27E
MSEPELPARPEKQPVRIDANAIWFTTVCPSCGVRYRLLFKFLDRKVRCDDCGRPFIAQSSKADAFDVKDASAKHTPQGWLIVCPACAHTELVSQDPEREHCCSMCDTPLPAPVIAPKKVRRRKPPKKHHRKPPKGS